MPDNPCLELAVSVTVLGPDTGPDRKTWGLEVNLSAGFTKEHDDLGYWIPRLPWLGEEGGSGPEDDRDPSPDALGFEVWISSNGRWERVAAAKVGKLPIPTPLGAENSYDPAPFRARLKEATEKLKNPLTYTWPQNGEMTGGDYRTEPHPPGAYPGLLLRISRLPAPIPQTAALQATILLALEKGLEKDAEIWVLPTLATTRLGKIKPVSPDAKTTPPLFDYEPVTSAAGKTLDVRARVHPVRGVHVYDRKNDYIDLQTLWVKRPENVSDLPREDWLPQYRHEVTRFLDLPLLLVRAIQAALEYPKNAALLFALGSEQVRGLRRAFVSMLRDKLGFGHGLEGEGFGPLPPVLARLLEPEAEPKPATVKLLAEVAATADPDVELLAVEGKLSWRDLLLAALGPRPDLGALTTAFLDESPKEPLGDPAAWTRELSTWSQLHAAVHTTDAVSAITFTQWDAAIGRMAGSELAKAWKSRAVELRAGLAKLDLRNRLEARLVKDVWSDLLPGLDDQSFQVIVTEKLKTTLRTYWMQRIGLAGGTAGWNKLRPVTAPGLPEDLSANIGVELEKIAAAFVSGILPSSGSGSGEVVSTRRLTIPVDRVGSSQDFDKLDQGDYANSVAGVGLLLQRDTSGSGSGEPEANWEPWRCASLAALHVGPKPAILAIAVAPWALHDLLGMRHATISYENAPLVAANPLGSAKGRTATSTDPSGDGLLRVSYEAIQKTLLEEKDQGQDPHGPWSRLPLLIYGRHYRMAAFLISNGGGLPTALREEPSIPYRLAKFPLVRTAEVPSEAIHLFHHLRDDPVGPLRMAYGGAGTPPALIVPERVFPLARELPELREKADVPLFLLGLASREQNTESSDYRNLGLSGDVATSAAFELRRPTVEFRVWEAWLGSGNNDRAAVIHELNRRRTDNATAEFQKEFDVTLDDPAITAHFVVEANRVHAHSDAGGESSILVADWPRAEAPVGLGNHQQPGLPVKIVCEATPPNDRLSLDAQGIGIVLRVAPGEIWSLRFSPTLDATDCQERFTASAQNGFRAAPSESGLKDELLAPPTEFLVEAAIGRAGLPSGESLYDLEASGQWRRLIAPHITGDRVRVTLDLSGLTPEVRRNYENIRSFRVRHQAWRWDGRPPEGPKTGGIPAIPKVGDPLDPLRSAPGSPTMTEAMKWEVGSFAVRRDDDVVLSEIVVSIPGMATQGSIFDLWERDHDSDQRCHYYRFAVEAVSRYEGLGAGEEVSRHAFRRFRLDGTGIAADQGSLASSSDPESVEAKTPWIRALLPCRPRSAPSQPKALFAVPLTDPVPTDTVSPSLAPVLVVLNERWFAEGGLAEKLEGRVLTARYQGGDYQEAGRDPVIDAQPPATQPQVELSTYGPLGHTFDLGTDQAGFVASSFVVQPSTTGAGPLDGWYFARVEFRRTFADPLTTSTTGSTLPTSSPPSPPQWVQFLPAAAKLENPFTKPDFSGVREILLPKKRLEPKDDGNGLEDPVLATRRVVLVTRLVTDVGGRGDREVYVGIGRVPESNDASGNKDTPDGAGTLTLLHGTPPERGCRLRLRILELRRVVDRSKSAASGEAPVDFWESVFPGRGAEATVQISVMSAPTTISYLPSSGNGGNR